MRVENLSSNEFQNWLPSKLFEKEGELMLEWIYLGDIHFSKPFFDETIYQCLTLNSMKGSEKKEKRITSIEFLSEVAQCIDAVDPGLFIFHTSRCGSTLATQILSLDKQNIVIPEYSIVDEVIRATIGGIPVSKERRKEWLKNLIIVLGQKRFSEEKRLIIKLDSWHFCFHGLIRELYPDVPFAIMFREPEAILSSNWKKFGMQFIPAIIPSSIFNIENPSNSFSMTEYANQVLQSMYHAINQIAHSDKISIPLDYKNGVDENIRKLAGLLNMEPSFMNRQEVIERMKFHSKLPESNFEGKEVQNEYLASEVTMQSYNRLNSSSRKSLRS